MYMSAPLELSDRMVSRAFEGSARQTNGISQTHGRPGYNVQASDNTGRADGAVNLSEIYNRLHPSGGGDARRLDNAAGADGANRDGVWVGMTGSPNVPQTNGSGQWPNNEGSSTNQHSHSLDAVNGVPENK